MLLPISKVLSSFSFFKFACLRSISSVGPSSRNSLRAILSLVLVFFLQPISAVEPISAYSLLNAKQGNVGQNSAQSQIVMSTSLANAAVGDVVLMPLPNASPLEVIVTLVKSMPNGDVSVVGEFGEHGSTVFTLNPKAVYGSITSDEISFSVFQRDSSTVVLSDARANSKYNLEGDYLLPQKPRSKEAEEKIRVLEQQARVAQKSNGALSTVDFLVVYPPEFASTFSNPLTRINQLVNFTNQSLSRSGVLMELRLVLAYELDFDNSADIGTNLTRATNGSGDFSELPAIRDLVGADMVAVLHAGSGFSASGIAWVNGDSASFAFSSTRISPGCCDSVFAHEVGHNLGSGHEHAAVNPNASDPCEGFFLSYACGHGAGNQSWGTVMSRLNDSAIGFRFSNLATDCLGQPCGVPEGQANPADNQRAFNISRLLIKDFRPTTIINPDPGGPLPLPPTARPELGWLAAIISLLFD